MKKKVLSFFMAFFMFLNVFVSNGLTYGEKKAGQSLSLDKVEIKEFKIVDVANGNKEIDYKTSDSADYDSFKQDPSKFSNAVCENQSASKIKLSMKMEYKGDKAIQEGDVLSIPMKHGGSVAGYTLKSLPLKNQDNNPLGTWEYSEGQVKIKFEGDFIKNNTVTKFTASFETGEILNTLDYAGRTFVKGERATTYGKIGSKEVAMAYEKAYVVSKKLGTTQTDLGKASGSTTDKDVAWFIFLMNDSMTVDQKAYYSPYLLEHNGQYNPKTLKNIYIEDRFIGNSGAPKIDPSFSTMFSGLNDNDEVISGFYSVNVPSNLLKEISQDGKTKEEIKISLKQGEYCVYDNKDNTYTLMLKWWDMDNPNGIKYDDVPQIKSAGGVGSYLKSKFPEIYGSLSEKTINKINDIYKNKALQNVRIYFNSKYTPVLEKTKVLNTAVISTDQTGTKSYPASAVLTPSSGVADAPTDPLSIKMIKADKNTGDVLSKGFTFELQTSTDDGANWKKVDLDASMVEVGTLNADKTVTPNEKGVVQVKKLTGGNMYRFVEKTHADGYKDVTINNDKPNDKDNVTSANSKPVKVTNQGKGHVIVMYNAKPETVSVSVEKKWIGKKLDSVRVYLYADGKEVTYKDLKEENGWKWTFEGKDKFDAQGKEIEYTIKEVPVANYKTEIEGDMTKGFVITNTNTEKVSIPVEKKWEDGENQDGKRKEIEVQLIADGVEVPGKKLTLNEGNSWKDSFKDFDKYKADGSEIKYTVKEVTKVEGYESEEPVSSQIGGIAGWIITNKHTPEVVKVKITKKWEDKNNQDGIRPEKISLVLYKTVEGTKEKVKEIEVTKANATADANKWEYEEGNLPKYEKGKLIKYTLEEEKVEGYESTITPVSENEFDVENKYTPKEIEVKVEKKWIGKELEEVKVQLLADGEKVAGKEVVLNKGNSWKDSFKNLPKFKDGKEIEYTIEEVKVEGYESKVEGNAKDGFVITNKITGKTEVTVEKKWIGKALEEVEVKLLGNGKEVEKVKLKEENVWKHTFKDLAKFDEEGKEIEYTIEEVKVEGYESKVEGNAKDGFVITNKITGKTEVTVEKKWIGKALEEVEVKLLGNGKEVEKVKLKEENAWKHTFKDLAKFDEGGKEIEYTIEEVKVEGYESKVEGSAKDGFVITNKEIPPTPPTPPTNEKPKRKTPKTAIGSNVLSSIAMAVISGGLLQISRKRRNK